MIFPNKVVSLDDSILALTPCILKQGSDPISIFNLYERVADYFDGVAEFILALDLLFILGRIVVDMKLGVVSYVDLN